MHGHGSLFLISPNYLSFVFSCGNVFFLHHFNFFFLAQYYFHFPGGVSCKINKDSKELMILHRWNFNFSSLKLKVIALSVLSIRKLKLGESIANIWPEFGSNKKELIKVQHFFIQVLMNFFHYHLKTAILSPVLCFIYSFLFGSPS